MDDLFSTKRPMRQGTKQAAIVTLLSRDGGATISDLVESTGWQAKAVHSTLATLKKSGWDILIEQVESGRRYQLISSPHRCDFGLGAELD